MTAMNITELIRLMQASIAPFVLISGIGLLLLSMTNRLSRPIDRIRELGSKLDSASSVDAEGIRAQMVIFYRRAHLLRMAILFATLSILCTSVVMIILFLGPLLGLEAILFTQALFVATLLCLVISLVFFLADVFVTLRAIKRDIADHLENSRG